MPHLNNTEQKWATIVLDAFAQEPGASPGESIAPAPLEVDYVGALESMMEHSNTLARVGIRIALTLVMTAPTWHQKRVGKTLADLDIRERQALLRELVDHSSFAVREFTVLMKIQAAMALMSSASFRERTGYDDARRAKNDKRHLTLTSLPC